MKVQNARWLVALAASSAMVLSACGGVTTDSSRSSSGSELTKNCPDNASTGLTDDEVKIGASVPLSGPSALGITVGFKAYLEYINGQGGVKMKDGKTRKISFTELDDQLEASRTRANVDELINREKVFALIGLYGWPGTLAARPMIMENCIPNLYITTGNPEAGNPDFPWVGAPTVFSGPAEARAAAEFITAKQPKAKIGVLTQNDDTGEAFMAAFKAGLKDSSAKLVETQTFEVTDTAVTGQITTLAGSGADVFVMLSGAGTFQMQALESIVNRGWEPKLKYVANFLPGYLKDMSDAADDNLHWSSYRKLPSEPRWADDPDVKLFLKWWGKQKDAKAYNSDNGVLGWLVGEYLVNNLTDMKESTREALLNEALHFTAKKDSLLLPGIDYSVDAPEFPYGMVNAVIQKPDADGLPQDVNVIKQQGKFPYEAPGK